MFRFLVKYLPLLLTWFSGINSFAQSVGGATSGAASFCGVSGSGFITLVAGTYTGSVVYWESSINGGATWTNVPNILTQQSYSGLTQTTCYRAVVQQGVSPADTSTVSCITVYPPTVPGTLSAGGNFCSSTGAGSVILSGNTGTVLNWLSSTDGGLTWTTIANTSTSLTYTNITSSIIYAAVVQNTSFCAVDTSTQSIFNIDPMTVPGTLSLTGNDSACMFLNNDTVLLSGNTGQVSGWLSSVDNGVTWNPIANTTNTQIYSGLIQNTLYQAIVQSGICPADTSASIGITILPLPTANAGIDSTIGPGQSVTLNGSGSGNPLWIPTAGLSNPLIFNPIATPTVTTPYVLIINDNFGCVNSDTVLISVTVPVFNGTVSNYFTPNGDGINDSWYIQNIQNYSDNEVFVYNIYGNEVFSKKGYTNDWKGTYNGSELPDGTYYYVLRFDKSSRIYKGSIDIIKKK